MAPGESTRGTGVTLGTGRKTANRARWVVLGLAVTVVAVNPSTASGQAAPAGATTRVSVASNGAQGEGGNVASSSLSGDARYVAFSTQATGLVPGDTNGRDDVFLHDRETLTTTRVSVGAGGAQGNGGSFFPDISADGRYIAFGSGASNLVADDTNATPGSPTASFENVGRDVFIHDRQTSTTSRVSVASDGSQASCSTAGALSPCPGGAAFADPSLSGDARYVAFSARADNLVPGDTNNFTDVFVRDRQASTTSRVSLASDGTQTPATALLGGGASLDPAISADGRFVAFQSSSRTLVTGDTNAAPDIFVHDRNTGTTTRVSVASDGTEGATGTGRTAALPAISADGRYVAFSSTFPNLVAGDTNGQSDIFVHDRNTGATTRVSVGPNGVEANDPSFVADIASNGRIVTFDSVATNLVAGDTNALSDVFAHDLQTGVTTRVSLNREATQGGAGSFFGASSADGRFVSFTSDSAFLVPGDTNGSPDVFVHDRTLPAVAARGYRLVASDGGLFSFGGASFLGSTGAQRLNQPIVGMASTPSGRGYWLVARDGGVFAFGDATFFGSTGAIRLAQPIVGMASTPSGRGYWLVASDGGIFAFGDATFLGSTGAQRLNRPIVGMATTPSGQGYLLVASDGGIFAFGDATFLGSTGAIRLAQPIVAVAASPSGRGYRLIASDGGVFAFGDAFFLGSTGAQRLNQPIVGAASTPTGRGYWLVARDGGVFAFGDASFLGSTGAIRLNQPIVGMSAS